MNRPTELPGLTVVRFFAALAVVWYHYGRFVDQPEWLRNVTMSGHNWVAFFFLLSGFILVYTARPGDRREFYVRRAARIVPVYLLAWVLFAACQLMEPISFTYWLKTAIVFGGLSLVFAQSWIPGAAQYWNTPAWSLSCEAFFYLCFPFVFAWVSKLRRGWLWGALLGLTVAAMGAALISKELTGLPLLPGTAFETSVGAYLAYNPAVQMIVFLVGVVLGRLYVQGVRMQRPALWLTMSVGAILMLSVLPQDARRDALLVPAFALLIFSLACAPNLVRGRTATIGVLLGNASYGVYILQEPLWYLYCAVTGTPRWGESLSLVPVLAYVVFLVGASVLIYQYFERPVERAIKSKFARKAPDALPALS